MNDHEYYVDADKIRVMQTPRGSTCGNDQRVVALCATDAGGMDVAVRIAEMLNGSSGYAPQARSCDDASEPTQEQIEGVACVFAGVHDDPTARSSAYIMAKKLKRIFVTTSPELVSPDRDRWVVQGFDPEEQGVAIIEERAGIPPGGTPTNGIQVWVPLWPSEWKDDDRAAYPDRALRVAARICDAINAAPPARSADAGDRIRALAIDLTLKGWCANEHEVDRRTKEAERKLLDFACDEIKRHMDRIGPSVSETKPSFDEPAYRGSSEASQHHSGDLEPGSSEASLKDAAQAVIDRWETPAWKDAPATAVYVNTLKSAVQRSAASTVEPSAWEVWWGIGKMSRAGHDPFRLRTEAEAFAKTIKSNTEVRPLYAAAPTSPNPVVADHATTETEPTDFCTDGPPAERKRVWVLLFDDADKGRAVFDNEVEAHTAWDKAKDHWTCTLLETCERKYFWAAGQLRPIAKPAASPEPSISPEIPDNSNCSISSNGSPELDAVIEVLQAVAKLDLWRDHYPDGPDIVSDHLLQRWFTPDQVRAARDALARNQDQGGGPRS